MQLDGPARVALKKYITQQIDEVKTELLYPMTEVQTATLRGRYVQLESMMQELIEKPDKPEF